MYRVHQSHRHCGGIVVLMQTCADGDSAIPVGRRHVIWEQLKAAKPSISLVLLNSLLTSQSDLQHIGDGAAVDDVDACILHFQVTRSAYAREYDMLVRHGEVPIGMRQHVLALDRYTLGPSMFTLVQEGIGRDKDSPGQEM